MDIEQKAKFGKKKVALNKTKKSLMSQHFLPSWCGKDTTVKR